MCIGGWVGGGGGEWEADGTLQLSLGHRQWCRVAETDIIHRINRSDNYVAVV